MRTYWDTSAIINAAVSPEVFKRLDRGKHFTRLHSFAEFFSTMTGRGVPSIDQDGNFARAKLTPQECAVWLRAFAEKIEIVELNKTEVFDALDHAQKFGVQGGHVYDYLHALAAKKGKADTLLTRNTDDFEGIASNAKWP